jgi:hypothetical protein
MMPSKLTNASIAMKSLPCLHLLALVLPSLAPAAVIFSGTVNLPIPQNNAGLYLNVFTGATAATKPVDWTTAPWVNPFQGGVYVANSVYLRPAIKGADQIENVIPGTQIGSTMTYTSSYSGSDKHMGPGADQFRPNTTGYMAFQMQASPTADINYGWLEVSFNNTGAGTVTSYAYESVAGLALPAGIPVPEASQTMLLGIILVSTLRRRRP